jgi:uncharacterized membrane protein YjjP (DUF1212 family)
METVLLAGKIMMMASAEMYRVEDTMNRIGQAANTSIVSYTTQTGIFVNVEGTSKMRMAHITKRSINLDKVTKVNQLSRDFTSGQLNIGELLIALKALEQEVLFFPTWLEVLSSGVIAATMMMIFKGDIRDFPFAFFVGVVSYLFYLLTLKTFQMRFLSEFLAALLLGAMSLGAARLGWITDINHVLIGCVMPFVPGVAITNSVRDLLAGHLLSGVSKGAEALITACMIGFGIAFVFQIFY